MKNYIRSWSFMRLFRLVMGVIITIQGWDGGYWWIVGIGIVFAVLPLLNVNTCNTHVCRMPRSRMPEGEAKDITFEEVK